MSEEKPESQEWTPPSLQETPTNDWKLEKQVVDALKTCFDPEIPVNIYELGLIYKIDAPPEGNVNIVMTLTSPMCPVAESLPGEVENKIKEIPEVKTARVAVTWDPPWSPEMMTEAAKLQLNLP